MYYIDRSQLCTPFEKVVLNVMWFLILLIFCYFDLSRNLFYKKLNKQFSEFILCQQTYAQTNTIYKS